tara:strand:- start:432 stop:830 length:399 start_codon:yes stop_codon:yes gene_type:complete
MSHTKASLIAQVNDFIHRFATALERYDSLKWELGSLMVEAKSMPDEMYSQVLPASEKMMHVLRQYEICAEKWEPCERCDQLSWFHHWVLRDREDRHDWIKLCLEDGIEEYEIRKLIRKEKKKERNDENRNAK